jgi:hypothetical protein
MIPRSVWAGTLNAPRLAPLGAPSTQLYWRARLQSKLVNSGLAHLEADGLLSPSMLTAVT